jgi:ADP-heptose:LPS heptosyltransferase
VLNALRDAFPQAYIAWLVEGRNGELLEGHPALDKVLSVPRHWLQSVSTALRVRRQLQALRIDTSIDLQGLTKSAVAAWFSGARTRIGFDGPDGREASRWFNNHLILPTATHVIDRNLELLRGLGITTHHARFDLPQTAADAEMAAKLVKNLGYRGGFAMINPGAGWTSKLWPRQRFAAVARHLSRTCGIPSLVVWAGPQELLWAREIASLAGSCAAVSPPTTLTQLAAITRLSSLFVSSDTGPLHLAVAVGTPSVGLYGPVLAERNGPYGHGHISLQQMQVFGTNRERRNASPAAMEGIRVEHVCDACDELFSRRHKLSA